MTTKKVRAPASHRAEPYHEIALEMRQLLKSDYAVVATIEADTVRIEAIVGGRRNVKDNPIINIVSKLRELGPILIDDSRIVAVPVMQGTAVTAVLAGYSLSPGAFTVDDLEKLTSYSRIAAVMLRNAATPRTLFDPSFSGELMHLAGLVTNGELSACFAHEVFNPLMLIRGHLRLINDGIAPDHPLRNNLDVIDRASRRIEDLAKRMLDFGRKRPVKIETCNAGELVDEALCFMQPYFNGRQIEVKIKRAPEAPQLRIDRWQLVQVLVNLMQNAADAMMESPRKALSIDVGRDNYYLRIAVSDTGKGIPPSDLPNVFHPFFTTKGECGTGLGLFIVRRVVEENAGTVSVQTSERGTTFVLIFPGI